MWASSRPKNVLKLFWPSVIAWVCGRLRQTVICTLTLSAYLPPQVFCCYAIISMRMVKLNTLLCFYEKANNFDQWGRAFLKTHYVIIMLAASVLDYMSTTCSWTKEESEGGGGWEGGSRWSVGLRGGGRGGEGRGLKEMWCKSQMKWVYGGERWCLHVNLKTLMLSQSNTNAPWSFLLPHGQSTRFH